MGQHSTPMTLDQALSILAYDISDLISRNGGYDGLIPDDRLTQDELIAALPDFFRRLGFDPFAPAEPPAAPEPTKTVHTCNRNKPGHPLPWGKKAPEGQCPRCDELRAGAAPRSAPDWVDDRRRRAEHDRQRDADRRQHFAPTGPHARGACGPVCTFGDW